MRAGEFAEDVGDVAAVALAEGLQECAVEDLVDECGFAGAGDAGDGDEQAEGNFDVDAAEVVDARAFEDEFFAAGLAAVFGDGDLARPERYLPVMELGLCGDLVDGACGEETAAEFAGAGAEVEEMVGGSG